ncbi:hypothetical protein [Cesiribacter sp. SM1]|uniref:hypothetical protein n=1 Tax=Cesiribacter sp. SM1 TaxID=2861196 RepID=UPI001CD4D1DF|nr:hypothetical protein [Cesiribacter sp. SM1]
MEYVGNNEKLLGILNGSLDIISSKIYEIKFYKNFEDLVIEIYLKLLYSKDHEGLLLKFTEVEEYSFYYNSQHIFYNVESYKFFKKSNKIHISFDPYDNEDNITSKDQDFIISKNVEGYLLPI